MILLVNFSFNTTGYFLLEDSLDFSYPNFFGLSLILISILIFMSRKSIDVLVVPTGDEQADEIRSERAVKEYKKGDVKKIMISGKVDKDLKSSQRYSIYKNLREHEIKPKDIYVSGGKNSIENISESFEKFLDIGRNPKSIGIVSYPSHLERFEGIIEKAKRKGQIPEDIKFYKIPTKESPEDFQYGFLANLKEKYNLEWLNKLIGPVIKKTIHYLNKKK